MCTQVNFLPLLDYSFCSPDIKLFASQGLPKEDEADAHTGQGTQVIIQLICEQDHTTTLHHGYSTRASTLWTLFGPRKNSIYS